MMWNKNFQNEKIIKNRNNSLFFPTPQIATKNLNAREN